MPTRGDEAENALNISWLKDLLLCCFTGSLTLRSWCLHDLLDSRTRDERLSIACAAHLYDLTIAFAVGAPAPNFRPFRGLPLHTRFVLVHSR